MAIIRGFVWKMWRIQSVKSILIQRPDAHRAWMHEYFIIHLYKSPFLFLLKSNHSITNFVKFLFIHPSFTFHIPTEENARVHSMKRNSTIRSTNLLKKQYKVLWFRAITYNWVSIIVIITHVATKMLHVRFFLTYIVSKG